MQTISTLNTKKDHCGGGGRIATDRYWDSQQLCQEFLGLDQETSRFDLLLLAKKVGKDAGFTPRMIQLLEYYVVVFTRDCDWEEGSRPIVFQSLSRTAMDLGVSERQIQQLEKRLFEAGAITWQDSGNHKRYGSRDPKSGRIQFAYGVDLTPLAYLQSELEDKLHQKQLYAQAWQATKREISALRRQIRSLLLAWQQEEGSCGSRLTCFEQRYQEIAVQLRTSIQLADLRLLLRQHQSLTNDIQSVLRVGTGHRKEQDATSSPVAQSTPIATCRSDKTCTHNKYTNPINESKSSEPAKCYSAPEATRSKESEPKSSAGLQHISLRQVLHCATERFRDQLPSEARSVNWNDVVEAAYVLLPHLHISQRSWAEACQILGREGAAISVLLTDCATQRSANRVSQPGAYFVGMIKKARVGRFRPQNSIFGMLNQNVINSGAIGRKL